MKLSACFSAVSAFLRSTSSFCTANAVRAPPSIKEIAFRAVLESSWYPLMDVIFVNRLRRAFSKCSSDSWASYPPVTGGVVFSLILTILF